MRPRRKGPLPRLGSRLARWAASAAIIAHDVVRAAVELSETELGELALSLSALNRNVRARRHRERPRDGLHWFTADEAALVAVLAELVVPSDDTGPGVADLARAGRPAVEALDRLVADSRTRQAVYVRGLPALDRLARGAHQARFVELSHEHQMRLLHVLDHVRDQWSRPGSRGGKIRTRVALLYHKWSGLFPAVELFQTVVQDVLQVFYTDRLSWEWLEYDGPPMPDGYRNVFGPRSVVPAGNTPGLT